MKLDEVISVIEVEIGDVRPLEQSGLFFRGKDEVNVIGFDVDPAVTTIDKAVNAGADLLVTHHLATWSPVSRIAASSQLNTTVRKLGAADMSLACYHLTWDFSRNDGNFLYLAKLLNLQNLNWITKYEHISGVTVVGELQKEHNLEDLVRLQFLPAVALKTFF